MIIISKLIFKNCGPGEMALEVFKQNPTQQNPPLRPDFSIKRPTTHNQESALVVPLIVEEKNFSKLAAWWAEQRINDSTSINDVAVKVFDLIGFKSEKPRFSTSLCCTFICGAEVCWFTIPVCNSNAPYQVHFKTAMEITLFQMATGEDYFDTLVEQAQLINRDANRELVSGIIKPQLNQVLSSMRILLEEKQKAWNPSGEIPSNIKPNIVNHAEKLAHKVAHSRVATDKTVFLAFEKRLDDTLSAKVKAKAFTETEARYIKVAVINHLVMRNKTMIAFINARAQVTFAPQASPKQAANAKQLLDDKMDVKMQRN